MKDKKYERICISNIDIVVLKDTTRVVVPPVLQYELLDWYHCNLLHPGITRTFETIKKHFFWSSLRHDVTQYVQECDICSRLKARTGSRYGHLPLKDTEDDITPWDTVQIDSIGP